jgi:23S rRNA A1618 N6-methylase RlmF
MNNKEQTEEMMNDKFKNAPIHDKQAIISMMDELEPKDMIEVVELLKSKLKQQNNMENLEQNASLFMEKGEKAFIEKVSEMMRATMAPTEKIMWINGYLSGLVDGKKDETN